MRIACFQGPARPETPAGNLAALRGAAAEAQRAGAALLVCPEMFLTGYAIGAARVAEMAEPVEGPSLAEISRIAAETRVALVVGFPERSGDGVYNAAIAIGPDGATIATYRKTHLFGEVDRQQFLAGDDEPALFELGGFKAALLICYDVEFPEMARELALRGVDLVIVPTALMQPYDVVARAVVPARAFENQLFIVYANRCDSERPFDYCGLSCIVAPDGTDLARAGRDEELIFADLDPVAQERSRRLNPYLADRRPELYGRLGEIPVGL